MEKQKEMYRVVSDDVKELFETKEEAAKVYDDELKQLKKDGIETYHIRLQVKSEETKNRWVSIRARKVAA